MLGGTGDVVEHRQERLQDSGLSLSADELTVAVDAGEVFAGAVLVGVLAARTGTANIPGSSIPLGPVLGLLGHGLALFHEEIGLPAKYTDHIHNVSNGFIGGWGTLYGMGIGAGMREKVGLAPIDVKVGGLPGTASSVGCSPGAPCPPPMMVAGVPQMQRLTEAERVALYRRRRAA